MRYTFGGFAGSNQARDERTLDDGVCAMIVDADPTLPGTLLPLKARSTVATVPTIPARLSIWRMGRDLPNDADYWLSWTTRVDAIRPWGADTTERTLFTGSGSPKWTDSVLALAGGAPYPQGVRELAVPNPDQPPSASLNVNGSTGTSASRYYVETFVNDIGWESGPSPASVALDCKPGATVNLTLNAIPPAGAYGFTTRRIYRTQPADDGTLSAEFYFLREVSIGTSATTDDARALGELLPTEKFLPPPSDGHSLAKLWNSMVAMLSGKTLYVCEPGYPYAYPLLAQKNLAATGVALGVWGENLLVLTTSTPVHFYGADPESMLDRSPGTAQPCRSARAVVSFPHGVVWPSEEGLAYYGDKGNYLVTDSLIRPDQWKAMNPSTMRAARWGRFYVCSWTDGAGSHAFMVDPLMPTAGIWYLSAGFDACHYDELADRLYLLEGGNVRRFHAGTALTAIATSKTWLSPRPTNLSHCRVEAKAYPVALKVYADGVLTETRMVTSRKPFTLKAGFQADTWKVEVSTSGPEVEMIRLGHSVADVATP